MSSADRFSPEVRARAVRLVRDLTKDHASQWAAIQAIAGKLGCTAASLRRWVRAAVLPPIEYWTLHRLKMGHASAGRV